MLYGIEPRHLTQVLSKLLSKSRKISRQLTKHLTLEQQLALSAAPLVEVGALPPTTVEFECDRWTQDNLLVESVGGDC